MLSNCYLFVYVNTLRPSKQNFCHVKDKVLFKETVSLNKTLCVVSLNKTLCVVSLNKTLCVVSLNKTLS